jgi:universal stress protein E
MLVFGTLQTMKDFRHILVVACPGFLEAPVLKRAAELAKASGAKLTVLDVVEPMRRRHRIQDAGGHALDLQALLIDDRRRHLMETVDAAGAGDAAVEVVAGKPFIEVTRFAIANDCDLVIVGEALPVEGRSRIVASDVTQLIRACPTPVWVMCLCETTIPRVLALVDPDPSDAVRDGLNDAVLELATSVTRREGGELHVAHAWQLWGESAIRSSLYVDIPPADVDKLVQEAGQEHRHDLEALASRHGVTELGGQLHLIKGSPSEVLPDLADRLNINLIVMGTVARRGVSGLIMGNTAETMLRSVRCSILTVKPEGFVSPVSV